VSQPHYETFVDGLLKGMPRATPPPLLEAFEEAMVELAEVISDWAGEARLAAIAARSGDGDLFTAEYARGYARAFEEVAEAIRRAVTAQQEQRA